MGKVPLAELGSTIKNIEDVYAVVLDGDIDQTLVDTAEKTKINVLVGMDKKGKSAKLILLCVDEL